MSAADWRDIVFGIARAQCYAALNRRAVNRPFAEGIAIRWETLPATEWRQHASRGTSANSLQSAPGSSLPTGRSFASSRRSRHLGLEVALFGTPVEVKQSRHVSPQCVFLGKRGIEIEGTPHGGPRSGHRVVGPAAAEKHLGNLVDPDADMCQTALRHDAVERKSLDELHGEKVNPVCLLD